MRLIFSQVDMDVVKGTVAFRPAQAQPNPINLNPNHVFYDDTTFLFIVLDATAARTTAPGPTQPPPMHPPPAGMQLAALLWARHT